MGYIFESPQKGAFIHVPMTGGHEVEQWLKKNIKGHNTRGDSHASYTQLKDRYNKRDLGFTFAIVRNPWERIVAGYNYYCSKDQPLTRRGFERFIKGKWGPTFSKPMTDILNEDPDIIIRYEDFNVDWQAIEEIFGCYEPVPEFNHWLDGRPYQDFYNKNYDLVDEVARRYRSDIDKYGYKFDEDYILPSAPVPAKPKPEPKSYDSINAYPLKKYSHIPSKAYILYIDQKQSRQYAEDCMKSCELANVPYELFKGYDFKAMGGTNVWDLISPKFKWNKKPQTKGAAACASASHYMIWRKIAEGDETCIVLEHDAIMLNPVKIEIPDDVIAVLGYKVADHHNYNNEKAVKNHPDQQLLSRNKHGGAHAYAITPLTARRLCKRLEELKNHRHIDNQFFINPHGRGKTGMMIIEPIAAIGWLRASTIWNKSAVDNYRPILDTFVKYYESSRDLGLKG